MIDVIYKSAHTLYKNARWQNTNFRQGPVLLIWINFSPNMDR